MSKPKEYVLYNKDYDDENGFFNVEKALSPDFPFLFCVGGRGRGKTYSTLRWILRQGVKFMFIRRTDTEIQTLCELDSLGMEYSENPFKAFFDDPEFPFYVKAMKAIKGRYAYAKVNSKEEWNDNKNRGEMVGHIVSLSTAGNVRGGEFKDVHIIFYDEFASTIGMRNTKLDGYNYTTICETVARDREDLIYYVGMSNNVSIGNPVFMEFGLVNACADAIKQGYNTIDFVGQGQRGIRIIILPPSEKFKKKKVKQALYQALPNNSRVFRSNIDNESVCDDFSDVKEMSLQNWKPWCIISDKQERKYTLYYSGKGWYMCAGVKKTTNKTPVYDLLKSSDNFNCKSELLAETWSDYVEGLFTFESYECKVLYHWVTEKNIYKE